MITRETIDYSHIDFREGEVLLIDKPAQWSSFKVVHEVRKITGVKKVGHAGTLDPAATGLLILCTGKKTKEIYKYQEQSKTYSGTILLGKSTPSMDLETAVIKEMPYEHISETDIFTVKEQLSGMIEQIPPMYSAVKFKGTNLYKLARKGKTVEREPRKVTVYRFDITSIKLPEINFEIDCSKGTYIRVIANDFGEKLGCGAVLINLRRTNIGNYSVENAISVQEFRARFSILEKHDSSL